VGSRPVSAEYANSVSAAVIGAPTAMVDVYLHAENLVYILEILALYGVLEVFEKLLMVAEL